MLNWVLNQFKRQAEEDLERAREMVKAVEKGDSQADLVQARETARKFGIEVDVDADADEVIRAIREYLYRHSGS